MTSPLVGVAVVVAVGILAMLLRRSRTEGDHDPTRPAVDAEDAGMEHSESAADEPEEDGEEDDPGAEQLALTSDGHAFAPQGHGVVIAPQSHFRRSHPAGDDGSRLRPANEEADLQPPVVLSPGDLIAARVVRGSPDLDPWRLETLGRDRDLVVWPFETRDAADAAHGLLERRVVKAAIDRDGDPVPIGDEDFEAAQAELEKTLDALNAPTEDDEIPPPSAGGPRR